MLRQPPGWNTAAAACFRCYSRSRMFWLFDTRNAMIIAMTIAVAVSFGQGIMFVPEATWAAELFQVRLRYSGSSLGFQIGAALSGGLTPMAASALLLWTGATWSISLYLTAL